MCGLGMNMKTYFSMVLWENTGFQVQGSGWKSHFCPTMGPGVGDSPSGGLLPAITQGCPLPPFGRSYRWNERQGFLSVCPSIYFQNVWWSAMKETYTVSLTIKKKKKIQLCGGRMRRKEAYPYFLNWLITGKCLEVLMRRGRVRVQGSCVWYCCPSKTRWSATPS